MAGRPPRLEQKESMKNPFDVLRSQRGDLLIDSMVGAVSLADHRGLEIVGIVLYVAMRTNRRVRKENQRSGN